MTYGQYYGLALAINLVIETPIVWALIRRFEKATSGPSASVLWCVIANLLSLPYLWFVLPLFMSRQVLIPVGELFVWLIEALVYYKALKLSVKRALLASLVANVASFVLGKVVFGLI